MLPLAESGGPSSTAVVTADEGEGAQEERIARVESAVAALSTSLKSLGQEVIRMKETGAFGLGEGGSGPEQGQDFRGLQARVAEIEAVIEGSLSPNVQTLFETMDMHLGDHQRKVASK